MTRHIVGIGGGIGASRVWRHVAQLPDVALTLIVNTADDMWHYGLRVCPDLDTTLYALSDRQDRTRGWGVRDESWRCLETLKDYGEDVWFALGDRDLATHLIRTNWLRAGRSLSEFTAHFRDALGVAAVVLPMTNEEVATVVHLGTVGWVSYEDYLVRRGAEDEVVGVEHRGVERSLPAPGVIEAIEQADSIVLAPSNPVASLDPVLSVPGVRPALRAARERVVGVSPIVSRWPISDVGEQRRAQSRAALLRSVGCSPTAAAVAARYADVTARFIVDLADDVEAAEIGRSSVRPIVAPTLLHLGAASGPLLAAITGIVSQDRS